MDVLLVVGAVTLVVLGIALAVYGIVLMARSGWPPRTGSGDLAPGVVTKMLAGQAEVPDDQVGELASASRNVLAHVRGNRMFALGSALALMGPALLTELGAELLGLWVVVNVPVLYTGGRRARNAQRYVDDLPPAAASDETDGEGQSSSSSA